MLASTNSSRVNMLRARYERQQDVIPRAARGAWGQGSHLAYPLSGCMSLSESPW